MRGYQLLKSICRMILPFVILYALYIIGNGDLSPGGGFQGGVVLATCYLLVFFIKDEEPLQLKDIIRLEKGLFALLIVFTIIHLYGYRQIGAFLPDALSLHLATASLVLLNLIIGFKVAIGFWGIMLIFTEEGQL